MLVYKRRRKGFCISCSVYTGPNEAFITKFKNYLNQTFTIKDHGDASYFIGIELLKTKKGFYVNQRKYVLDIWSEAGLTDI